MISRWSQERAKVDSRFMVLGQVKADVDDCRHERAVDVEAGREVRDLDGLGSGLYSACGRVRCRARVRRCVLAALSRKPSAALGRCGRQPGGHFVLRCRKPRPRATPRGPSGAAPAPCCAHSSSATGIQNHRWLPTRQGRRHHFSGRRAHIDPVATQHSPVNAGIVQGNRIIKTASFPRL